MAKLQSIAMEVLRICDEGAYTASSGTQVSIASSLAASKAGTVCWTPEDLRALRAARAWPTDGGGRIEVTGETTQVASHRLVVQEGVADVVALNFASAKNPGGGFLGGARAQEEDVCRCSALYPCLLEVPAYYETNRAHGRGEPLRALYTDHLIYTPRVPFFRTAGRGPLIESPFEVSVLTAPAPNTGAVHKHCEDRERADAALRETFARRAALLLALMAHHGHRVVVLGAWGCGAFRGDPELVAGVFRDLLEGEFAGAFERAVFPVFDPRKGEPNRVVFERVLG